MGYLVINSKFQPFNFDQMLKPYQLYGQEYSREENLMDQASQQTGTISSMLKPNIDTGAMNIVKSYNDQLNNYAQDLYKNGLSSNTKQSGLQMRQLYNSSIVPLQQAIMARQQDAERQQKMYDQDHSIMFSKQASLTPVTDYINGGNSPYVQVSNNDLYAKAAQGAQALSKRMQSNGQGSLFHNQYYSLLKRVGTQQSAATLVSQNKDFQSLVENIANSSGAQYLQPVDKKRAMDSILAGINAGLVYEQTTQPIENYANKSAIDFNNQVKLMNLRNQAQLQLAQAKAGLSQNSDAYKPNSIEHIDAQKNDMSDYNKAINELHISGAPLNQNSMRSKYFGVKGNINPMKTYEQAQQANKAMNISTHGSIAGDIQLPLKQSIKYNSIQNPNIRKESIISSDTYNALKKLGYTSSTPASQIMKTFDQRVNGLAKQYDEMSINVPKSIMSQVSEDIYNKLDDNVSSGISLDGKMYLLDDKFEPKNKTLDISDIKPGDITNVGHSVKYPYKLILHVRNKGMYLTDPSLISAQLGNIVNEGGYFINKNINNTSNLKKVHYGLLQNVEKVLTSGKNQGLPATNSKSGSGSLFNETDNTTEE